MRLLRIVLPLAAAAVVLLAAACGGSDESGEVSFLAFGDPPEIAAYRTLIREFERHEPDVDVQLIEASDRDDLLTRLSASLAGGRPPDLFLMNYRFYGQFAARGTLEPLGPYVEDSEQFTVEDLYPQAVDAFRWNGELTCVPQNISSLVVYFNRDLFRRFGVPPPTNGMQWSDFVATAQQMTRDAKGQIVAGGDPDAPGSTSVVLPAIYGLGVEPTIIRIAPFVWSSGGEVVDDPENPTRFTLDGPESLHALGQFFGLRTIGVVPSDTEVEAEDDESRFVNGRLAMVLASRRAVPTFREAAKFDWDIVSLPVFGKPAGILHSDAYCLTKRSDAKEAAWRFVEYAIGPEGAPVIARTGRTVPSLRSVAESDAFLDPEAKPRNSRVFLDGIESIRRVPSISTWPEIEDASEGILENGMYLGQDVRDVVAELEDATTPIFARAER